MSRQIVVKPDFQRAYNGLPEAEKKLVDAAIKSFGVYIETGRVSGGLGIKHLGHRTYEFRAGLRLRIIYVIEKELIILSLLGSHDDVRRFLKKY